MKKEKGERKEGRIQYERKTRSEKVEALKSEPQLNKRNEGNWMSLK
jgi:hypothetical protein